MLQEERNITPIQYARDIIWPSLALRKLAEDRLQVSDAELQQAYETQFGPQVQVRLIALSSLERARELLAAAQKNPDEFGNLAKQYSEDVNSASVKGLVPPIRKHLGAPALQVAFSLQPGQISDVIAVDNQYVILKCDLHIAGKRVPMEQVHKVLLEACRDKKLRLAASDIFADLQKQARIENYFSDPVKRQQHPGVAAVINNRQITVLELAEECIERNGKQCLEGTINRRLLEQACKAKNYSITKQEMDEEVARAAASMGKTLADGRPDVDGWLKEVAEKQKTSLDLYFDDVVWPTVALKKLVKERVEVNKDDLQKGYEANFGQRVRCLAIVFNQPRKAQEVWEMARNHMTADFFGNLAEEYSVEPSSRALRGEIPPIQKFGGQPVLEKEAFAMQPGELSGVIQVSDKYVILFCLGFTEPTKITFEEVRDQIFEDIYEKKLRLSMAKEFTSLQEIAQIDNFIANTTQSPYKGKSANDWAPGQSISQPKTARKNAVEELPGTLRR
jgi:parvulin-like peptidyl-prolyl isomerase